MQRISWTVIGAILALQFSLLSATAQAGLLRTYVTGESGASDVIFRVDFDPTVAGSAVVSVAVTDGFGLDGIDFIGTGPEVAVGAPIGKISHYNVVTGAILPDFVADTDLVAVPPLPGGTHPSTILTTASHIYYIENQFGFGGTPSHRIMREPIAGGAEEVVFDGAGALPGGADLENLEGLEIVGGRLYFFARDPGSAIDRAMISIALTAGGVWDGVAPTAEISGLKGAGAVGAADGSDELDFDPSAGAAGVIFGTNIVNGEIVAYDLMTGAELISPGSTHFIDETDILAGGGLSLLLGSVDGIRADGAGHLIFVGRAGVMGAIDIAGVLFDGADPGDITPLFVSRGGIIFDDLTPLLLVPEPATLTLFGLGLLSLGVARRRQRRV